jgi:hypothetical protein
MKSKKKQETLLVCPECHTEQVVVYEEHAVMANTFEHWCHSVKAHDSDAKARCLECEWTGTRAGLHEEVK